MSDTATQNVPKLRFKAQDGITFPDWERKRLGDVTTVFSGGTPSSSNRAYYAGTIPFIGSGDISSDHVEQFITEAALAASSAKLVNSGDLLYALYGATSGEVAISRISGAINQAVLCIRSTQDRGFLFQWLRYSKERITTTYLQGGQGNLSGKIVNALKVSLPHIKEQQRIASFLSSVDTKVQQLEKKKTLWEQYKKGCMQQIFTQQIRFKADDGSDFPDWTKGPLGSWVSQHVERTPADTDLPVFSSTREGLKRQSDYFSGNELANLSDYGVVPPNFLTFRHMSDDHTFKFNLNETAVPIAVSKEYPVFGGPFVEPAFLKEWLNHSDAFARFAIQQKLGGTRTRLYFRTLAGWVVSLPTLKEQLKIAEFLKCINQKIDLIEQELTQAKTFKKGLLQQMFV